MTSPERQQPEEKDALQKAREHFSEHRVQRILSGIGWKALMLAKRFQDPDHYKPGHATAGLLEGAIIANPLFYLDQTQGGLPVHETTGAGLWMAWDPWRPDEFPDADFGALRLIARGSLYTMLPDRLRGNRPEHYTPTNSINTYNFDDVLSTERATPDSLITNGLACAVTYEKAFRTMGIYGRYGAELDSRGIADDPVLQITPKGNSLVHIAQDSGHVTPKHDPQPAFNWLPGRLAT